MCIFCDGSWLYSWRIERIGISVEWLRQMHYLYIAHYWATNKAISHGQLQKNGTVSIRQGLQSRKWSIPSTFLLELHAAKHMMQIGNGITASCAPHHVGILGLIDDVNIIQLDVEVLIHRVQCSWDCQIILQFHCDLQRALLFNEPSTNSFLLLDMTGHCKALKLIGTKDGRKYSKDFASNNSWWPWKSIVIFSNSRQLVFVPFSLPWKQNSEYLLKKNWVPCRLQSSFHLICKSDRTYLLPNKRLEVRIEEHGRFC